MIVVRLYGGLGNQLFQYATARRLALHNNSELVLDTAELGKTYAHVTARKFELCHYPVQARLLSYREQIISKLYTNRVLRRLPLARTWRLYREKEFSFDSKIMHLQGDIYLDGYWQCPQYFNDIEGILRLELTPILDMGSEDNSIYDDIKSSNSVSIHVRRGDYVTLKSAAQAHGICSLEYYRKAIGLMAERVENPKFFIFSDDPVWVSENIKTNFPTVFVTHNVGRNAYLDLRLMSLCHNQIIANSSFSWWGAWLNESTNKVVVAPARWFANDTKTPDLIPQSWLTL